MLEYIVMKAKGNFERDEKLSSAFDNKERAITYAKSLNDKDVYVMEHSATYNSFAEIHKREIAWSYWI